MGSLVKSKFGNMGENTREGRSRSRRKEVACKKRLLYQFEYCQSIDMSSCLLVYVFLKQEVCLDMDEPILELPEKEQGELLNIYGYPDI